MATLDWHVTSERGVTLVELLVESEATERVRVENCLDGPVWPPRRQGVPAEGWDEDGYEGVVTAEDRLVLGYASPADPADPPARLASVDPEGTRSVTARDVVRTLGDPTPPREAVVATEETPSGVSDSEPATGPKGDGHRASEDSEQRTPGRNDNAGQASETDDGTATVDEWQWGLGATSDDGPQDRPESDRSVETVLDDVADRIEEAERLAGVASVSEASEAVASVGGPEDIARLGDQLDDDRDRLRELAERCEALAARAEAVEIPVETLKRLA